MPKFSVTIIEILEGVIEVEAENLQDALKQVQEGHEQAGKTIKPLETVEMNAIFKSDKEKTDSFRLI